MIDGVLRVLIVGLGLLLIWWVCGPAAQRGRAARPEGREASESEGHVDAHGR